MESKALALGKQVCALAKNSNVHQMEITLKQILTQNERSSEVLQM
jgi:hypothetical protein